MIRLPVIVEIGNTDNASKHISSPTAASRNLPRAARAGRRGPRGARRPTQVHTTFKSKLTIRIGHSHTIQQCPQQTRSFRVCSSMPGVSFAKADPSAGEGIVSRIFRDASGYYQYYYHHDLYYHYYDYYYCYYCYCY